MEELAHQERIPHNWQRLLISLLRRKQSLESSKVLDEETPTGDETITKSVFKPDNYIFLNITKDPTDEEIYFVPTQFVSRFIENNLIHEAYELAIRKLEYMTLLSLALIEKLKANFAYNEKLVEFSTVSTYGIWKIPENRLFNVYSKKNKINYLMGVNYDFAKLKKCFGYHEPNFLSCIDNRQANNILNADSKLI